MPEMTEHETPTKKQHRKKNRETHNAVERHRKKKINAGINRIGELIPCSPALKQSKNMILDQAFKYITELKRQNDELLLNGGSSEQGGDLPSPAVSCLCCSDMHLRTWKAPPTFQSE